MKRYYYEVMGLSTDASRDQIKFRYRELVRIYHPDNIRHPDDKQLAEQKLKEVITAYKVLSKHKYRRRYLWYPKLQSWLSKFKNTLKAFNYQQICQTYHRLGWLRLLRIISCILFVIVLSISVLTGNIISLSLSIQQIQIPAISTNGSTPVTDRANLPHPSNALEVRVLLSTPTAIPELPQQTLIKHTSVDILLITDESYRVNARADATTNSAVVEVLEPGTKVAALGRTHDRSWIHIQLADGRLAWISIHAVKNSQDIIEQLPLISS